MGRAALSLPTFPPAYCECLSASRPSSSFDLASASASVPSDPCATASAIYASSNAHILHMDPAANATSAVAVSAISKLPFHEPYLPDGSATGIQNHRPPLPPENPSTFRDLFMQPLSSQTMFSPQPQQTFNIPPKTQLTPNVNLGRSSETAQHLPTNNPHLRTLPQKLHIPQEQSQALPYVAPSHLDQRVQVARVVQVVNQTLPEPNIQASRLAARKQLEQNVQAAQSALNKAQTKVKQQNQQTAGHQAPRPLAQFPARTASDNEAQAITPRQRIQPQTQSLDLTPTPHYLSSYAWPSIAPQTDPPISLPLTQISFVPDLQNIGSRSLADRDRDTLGVSISADQHEIRAAYWKREFECHPARHRESTSAVRAVMAEQLDKAQEAVDRLGGFAGMGWGIWEGLDEYSNRGDSMSKDGKE